MTDHFQKMASRPAYMARIPDSRVRRLPPMTPIREASTPGTADTQQPATSSSNKQPDVLKVDDFPEEYRYLVTRAPQEPKPKPSIGGAQYPEVNRTSDKSWHPYQIDVVVDQYLQSVSLGADPMEPQPNALCKCCSDVNDVNRRKQMERRTHAHYRQQGEHPALPNAPKYQPMTHEEAKAQDYTADYGIFRTESPQLLSDSNYHIIPDYEQKMLDSRKVFVTHPAKQTLYSSWGVQNELETMGYDRQIAENVVQASSNFIDAMDKLKKFGHNEDDVY